MLDIKLFLLLTLISFSYEDSHCLQYKKICNPYSNPKISHCTLGQLNICMQCEDDYSLSNERDKCLNIPNCEYFDEDEKCQQCNRYYNLDKDGNCVKDYCKVINQDFEEKTCLYCFDGFYNDKGQCKRIPIPYCLEGDENTCNYCAQGATLKDGKCEVPSIFLEGCYEYNEDRTCKRCEQLYDLNNGKCTFQNNCGGMPTLDFCTMCEDGYYLAPPLYQCVSYDGTKDSLSNNNDNKARIIEIKYIFVFLLLMLLF